MNMYTADSRRRWPAFWRALCAVADGPAADVRVDRVARAKLGELPRGACCAGASGQLIFFRDAGGDSADVRRATLS